MLIGVSDVFKVIAPSESSQAVRSLDPEGEITSSTFAKTDAKSNGAMHDLSWQNIKTSLVLTDPDKRAMSSRVMDR